MNAVRMVLACTLLTLAPLVAANHADQEPNNTCNAAVPWPDLWSDTSNGNLEGTGFSDWTSFQIYRTEVVHAIITAPVGADFDGSFWRGCDATGVNGDEFLGSDEDLFGSDDNVADSNFGAKMDVSGVYGFKLRWDSGPAGAYTLRYEIHEHDAVAFAATHRDGGDSLATATPLGNGAWSAAIPNRGGVADEDFWSVDVPALTKVSISMTPDCPNDFDLVLLRPDGGLLALGANPGCATEAVSCTALAPTTVAALVFARVGEGAYDITVTRSPLSVPPPVPIPGPYCHANV